MLKVRANVIYILACMFATAFSADDVDQNCETSADISFLVKGDVNPCVQAEDSCVFAVEERRDCGYGGITAEQCVDRGCCHNSSTGGIPAPHCFYSQIGACDVPEYDRRDCGYYGITPEECESKGCCHVPASNNGASCFPKTMDPATEFHSNGDEKHDIFILTHRNSVSFTVKACYEVYVYLRTKAYSDETGYRFILGVDNNTHTVRFMKYVANTEVHANDHDQTEPVLTCDEDRSFYVEWLEGNVWLRTGANTILVEYEDPELLNIVELRLFTQTTPGDWYIQNNMGREINVASIGQQPDEGVDLVYKDFWMELVPQQTAMKFKIGANKNTYLVLCNNYGKINTKAYEIGVGTEENTKSHIKNRDTGEMIDLLTEGILTGPGKYRHLWISWKDGHVQLGLGHTIGEDVILDQMNDQYNVRFVSVANIDSAMAYWEFRKNTEDLYFAHTPAAEGDEVENWENRAHFNTHSTHVFFTVHTCAEAYVYLATDASTYRYEIILGYEDNTEISMMVYMSSDTRLTRGVDGLVSCTEPRMFWINWIDTHVVVGRGSRLDQHVLLTYYNSQRTNDITGLAFRSKEHTAEWTIAKSLVYQAIFQPYNNNEYNYWVELGSEVKQAHAVVQGCSDVHFIFAEYAGVVDRSCVVVLGTSDNRVNLILDGYQGRTLTSYNNSVIDCNRHHNFWFTWDDEQFRVGVGTSIGEHFIMDVPLEEFSRVLDIRAIGVASYSSLTSEPMIQFADSNEVAAYTYFSKPENNRALQFITHRKYFQFKVRVCSSAVVILSDNPDMSLANSYEVHIGTDGNTRVTLLKNGQNVKTVTPEDAPLFCHELRSFWITWLDKTIKAGAGDVINEREYFSYEDTQNYIAGLHSVKLESADPVDGHWVISKESAVSARITTEDRKTYNNIWLSVDTQSHIIFSVRATNQSYIALGTLTGTPGIFETTEIHLDSTQSTISYKDQHTEYPLTAANTSNILSETEYRYFWISWYNGNLEVGSGSTVSQGVFMNYQFDYPIHYVTLALSSGKSLGQAYWTVSSADESFAQLHTSGLYFEETQFSHLTTNLKFKLKACREAHVGMFAGNDYSDKSYELVIGGRDNTITYIKKGFSSSWEPDQEMSTPDILSCYEPREFTLNWGPGGISLIIDSGIYFTWVDPDYKPVDFLSFATDGVIGTWYFPRVSGDKFTVKTYNGEKEAKAPPNFLESLHENLHSKTLHDIAGEYKYNTFWLAVAEQRAIRFMVKACAEAHVVLTKYYGVADFEAHEIRIGENQDTTVGIYIDRTSPCNSVKVETLDCLSYQTFWVTWDHGIIQIGQGDNPGSRPLTACVTSYLEVSGISVATDKGEDGIWIFEDYRGGESLSFWTDNDYPHWSVDKAWMVPRQQWFTFEVQTTEWVVVALSEQPWNTDTKCHEIHIGYQEHTSPESQISYIVDKDYDESPKLSVKTPSVVDNGNLNAFWISWENQKLLVGYGYGKNAGAVLMELSDFSAHTVNGVGFSTPKANSRWELPKDLARQFHIKFPSEMFPANQIEASIRGLDSLVFQCLSIDAIEIYLVTDSGDTNYTFTIGYDNNRYTRLFGPDISVLKETPDILSSVFIQVFWIAWDSDVLEIGKGGEIGQDVIISQKMQTPNFHKAVFASLQQSDSEFIFVEMLGQTYNLLTNTDWGYNLAWMETTQTEVNFRVRACADAHILLAQDLMVVEENKVYEIVLGGSGNTILYLRKGPLVSDVAHVFADNMLNCNALKRFWVSWNDNTIRVGSGYRSQGHVYLEYTDDNFIPVNYLALSSGFGSEGEWEIQHGQSEGIIIYTPSSDNYNYENAYITLQGQNFIQFQVKACSDAHVALSEIPSVETFDTYEFVIGSGNIRSVAFRKGITGDFILHSLTQDDPLLECDVFKDFWISWDANSVKIGQSKDVYKNLLMNYISDVNKAFEINGISFKTGNNVAGEWRYISHGVNPGNGGLSGGAVAGIVIGVLVAIVLILAVLLIFVHPVRVKAEQFYITVKDKFTSPNPNARSFESPVYASEVGFSSEA